MPVKDQVPVVGGTFGSVIALHDCSTMELKESKAKLRRTRRCQRRVA
jgi:hypothetical protein